MSEKYLFIPRFRIEECLDGIRDCLERGWTGLGYKTVEFERAWAEYTALPHAHFLNSNTSGLHLALECFKADDGWENGAEVITTPLTFVSTNHAILHAGLTPVFADVDETLCLDPQSVRSRITERTRAVMFVGLGGQVGRLDEIVALCREHRLRLILDAAHMAGTRHRGRHVGHEADAAIFSFQAVKNLPTADSGMICFATSELDTRARRLTWLGIDKDTYTRSCGPGTYKWRYDVPEVGFKYHGNSIMGAIGLVQLGYLDADNDHRRRLAARYRERLAGHPGIATIPIADHCQSSSHLFQIRVARRDKVMLDLNAHGIFPGVHYHDNTNYPMYAHAAGTCPRAADASASLISLPLHLGLTLDDVDEIAARVIIAVAAGDWDEN